MSREKQKKLKVETFTVEFDASNVMLQKSDRVAIQKKVMKIFESHGIRVMLIGWGEVLGGRMDEYYEEFWQH